MERQRREMDVVVGGQVGGVVIYFTPKFLQTRRLATNYCRIMFSLYLALFCIIITTKNVNARE